MNNSYSEIGFFIHTAEMFNHYRQVWKSLINEKFDIVIFGSNKERKEIRTLAYQDRIAAVDFEDLIKEGHVYEILVSNHAMHQYNHVPLITLLGKLQVRFMYALGTLEHNLAAWNKYYHIALCFGPYQAKKLNSKFALITIQMGYPRYDPYFNGSLSFEKIHNKLKLDKSKKTLLWLPSILELSSVDLFADAIADLSTHYNVIVKTHPSSREKEPNRLTKLAQLPFTKLITDVYDNLNLFLVSDLVFCDYGGSSFGALYLDKPLILLDVPDAEKSKLTGPDSPDIDLRNKIVHIEDKYRYQLTAIIENEAIWREQKIIRHQLREKYFSPYFGFSSYVAALAIKNSPKILMHHSVFSNLTPP